MDDDTVSLTLGSLDFDDVTRHHTQSTEKKNVLAEVFSAPTRSSKGICGCSIHAGLNTRQLSCANLYEDPRKWSHSCGMA